MSQFWRFALSFCIFLFPFSILHFPLLASAWVEPPSDATNIAAPINTSSSPQTKQGNLTVSTLQATADIVLGPGRTLYSPGRMHIYGEENLYLLNKGGVIVSRAWGGNGNLWVDNKVTVPYLNTNNGTWLPWEGNNWNYLRGNSFAWNGVWYDENDTNYQLDPNGETHFNVLATNILYDHNNFGYYLNPDGWSNLNALNVTDLRFSYMYDNNNTSYYIDPNNWSNFAGVNVTDLRFSYAYDNNNTGYYLDLNNWSNFNAVNANFYHTNLNDSWFPYPGNNYNYFRGNSFMNGVLYDENNSGYYLDPSGWSNLNAVNTDYFCIRGNCRTDWRSLVPISAYAAPGGCWSGIGADASCPPGYHIVFASLSITGNNPWEDHRCFINWGINGITAWAGGCSCYTECMGLCEKN